ncbi:MAG: nucleotidyltransferase domain-containing protein [Defluviitaleaceae bacterium]|nr:nucleotidyltransferase domain-containing protein [Defluviitaleaceae bacterium]
MHINDVIDELKVYLNSACQYFLNNVERIILFGSYARNAQKIGSDIDLALVATNGWQRENRILLRDVLDDFSFYVKINLFAPRLKRSLILPTDLMPTIG